MRPRLFLEPRKRCKFLPLSAYFSGFTAKHARFMRSPRFMHDLEDFIRVQVARFPHLKAQVEQENTARDKRQKLMRNYLSPVNVHDLPVCA